MTDAWTLLAEVPAGPDARIYAEGWQSWSPTTWYGRGDPARRPEHAWQHLMRFRPGADLPEAGLQAEGLLVIDPGDGAASHVFACLDASTDVPSIRAQWLLDRVLVRANGPIEQWMVDGGGGEYGKSTRGADAAETTGASGAHVHGPGAPTRGRPVRAHPALLDAGARFAAAAGARTGPAPRVWCTWYQYFEAITAADIIENVRAIDEASLPVEVIQIDDGWSLGTGEWTRRRPGFGSLEAALDAIGTSGRRAGLWLAPFSVGASSDVARQHPDWLTGPAGYNWGDDLVGLDLTHPGVRDYLVGVFAGVRDLGIDYLKLDFLYAGAVPGSRWDGVATPIAAYRSGLALIREVMGPDAYLLGCGAPILPSVGLVDAMRVASDTFHEGGENGSDGLRGKEGVQARSWQDGLLWMIDPDCLVARPSYALRDAWAGVVLDAPGVRGFSDRLADLDAHGLNLVCDLFAGDERGDNVTAGKG